MLKFPISSVGGVWIFSGTFLLVDLRKIQYARDDERPHFCINLNNIDNEVYCDVIVMLTSFQTISSINYVMFYFHYLTYKMLSGFGGQVVSALAFHL